MTMPEMSPLENRLRHPSRIIPAEALAGTWFHAVVAVRADGAASMAADPRGVGWVRGAWGMMLKSAASPEAIAGQACPWGPPCALDVFFRCQGFVTPGLEIPKPYTLRLAADGRDLIVELRVFGLATEWLEAAADALVRALREGVRGPGGRGLTVTDRQTNTYEAIAVPPPLALLGLRFETPLELRREDGDAPILPSLIASLCNRISGLARWQDAAVEDGWASAMLAASAELQVLDRLERLPSRLRSSSRQGVKNIPVHGMTGDLILAGDLSPLLPLLTLGQTTHAGSHAAIGQGAYTLMMDG